MNPSNPALPDLQRLQAVLATLPQRVIACSGGIDSLLLATLAHRADPAATQVVHAVSPAVPMEATARVRAWAAQEGWTLEVVESGEFGDEDYLSNPANRCYHCKRHLYDRLHSLSRSGHTVLSGANLDDLGEYRPGLTAAAEKGVRHPWVEAGISKAALRQIARDLGLPFAELPASPCLASRLYTGTRVTASRVRAVEAGELLIRQRTGIDVVRCRLREDEILIEVGPADRAQITPALRADVLAAMRLVEPAIASVELDALAYRPGRSFVLSPATSALAQP
jgi:uncharacterized protein